MKDAKVEGLKPEESKSPKAVGRKVVVEDQKKSNAKSFKV